MEFILILLGILIVAGLIFILVESPFYLVSVFVFLHIYSININLPGPLDLRGLVSVVLIIRLMIIDRKNLDLIKGLFSNKFFIIITSISLYFALVDYFNDYSLVALLKIFVLNITALIIGFLTVINGYAKKTIALAILIAGVMATGDLLYTYAVESSLYVKRIIEVIISGGTLWQTLNHNYFGSLCGIAFLTTFLLRIYKNIDKLISTFLLIVFSLGMLISTSRMNFVSVVITLVFILLTQKEFTINLKKVFRSALATALVIFIVLFSYSYILSAMNIKSKFADQIYYRLVEEPMSIFDDKDYQKFGWDDNRVEGTMRWRYYKILRDADEFFKQNNNTVLFGFGTGGYAKIGEIQFLGGDAYQYSSHNFYINLIAEHGIVGLLLFLFFFFYLLHGVIKMIVQGKLQFSLVYLLFYMFIFTFGGEADLTEKFGFILYGSVIADIIRVSNFQNQKIELQE